MNNFIKIGFFTLLVCIFVFGAAFKYKSKENKNLDGAWLLQNGDVQEVLLFADGYFTHTTYNTTGKKFVQTNGGAFRLQNNQLIIAKEFDTHKADRVGQSFTHPFSIDSDKLTIDLNAKKQVWKRIDDAENLAGTWKITARKQGDVISPIHQTGPRKTVKILTGTRFQWIAINPASREFFGTGGGTYSFANGKYTENIAFFSRDSSRVGASLSFDGKIQNGDWHHSGKSSRGDDIYEVWSRIDR